MLSRLLPTNLSRGPRHGGPPPRVPKRRARPALEALEARVVLYSASGNAWPNPALITISFMPDGTLINGTASNLVSSFDAKFGVGKWETTIEKAAQAWAAATNINFAVVPDSGAANGSGGNQQGDPNFGDIRIGGDNFGSSTLAQAYMPPPVNNYSIAGDITFNTGQAFGSTYDLYTVAAHEIGHALGLYHSGIASAELYSSYNGAKGALTGDDIAGIQSIYGGARKPDGNDAYGPNDTIKTASNVNPAVKTSTLSGVVTGLDITTTSDVDMYKMTVPTGTDGTMTVAAVSTGLSLLSPKLTLLDQSGNTLGSASNAGAYGTSAGYTQNRVKAGQTYYIEVTGAEITAMGTGAYALTLDFGPNPTPAVPTPNMTKANGSPLSAGGGQVQNVNQEMLVNTFTNNHQTLDFNNERAVAVAADGNYVVTWQSQGQDGSGWGVYAQRFGPGGVKLGGEFRVNTTTAGDQTNPAVAMDKAGDFLITWVSKGQDGSGLGVYAQRYNASGLAQGGEFQVNTTTAGDQTYPTAAMDDLGDSIITWQSQGQDGSGWGVYAQRYGLGGLKLGGEFRVNTTTAGDQTNPSVGMDQLGDVVIAWQSHNQDGNGWGIYAQHYGILGLPVGGEFRVNTTTQSDQQFPSVAVSTLGAFAVAWQSKAPGKWGIFLQRYNNLGLATGGEVQVSPTAPVDQIAPAAAMDAAGDLLITWTGQPYQGNTYVVGQQYTATGTALGGPFAVNTSTNANDTNASVAMNDQGSVVSVWAGGNAAVQSGVMMQQYTISFAGESSDGFYAKGDPHDPDQAHAPAPTTPPVRAPHPVDAALQAIEEALARGLVGSFGGTHAATTAGATAHPATAPPARRPRQVPTHPAAVPAGVLGSRFL